MVGKCFHVLILLGVLTFLGLCWFCVTCVMSQFLYWSSFERTPVTKLTLNSSPISLVAQYFSPMTYLMEVPEESLCDFSRNELDLAWGYAFALSHRRWPRLKSYFLFGLKPSSGAPFTLCRFLSLLFVNASVEELKFFLPWPHPPGLTGSAVNLSLWVTVRYFNGICF